MLLCRPKRPLRSSKSRRKRSCKLPCPRPTTSNSWSRPTPLLVFNPSAGTLPARNPGRAEASKFRLPLHQYQPQLKPQVRSHRLPWLLLLSPPPHCVLLNRALLNQAFPHRACLWAKSLPRPSSYRNKLHRNKFYRKLRYRSRLHRSRLLNHNQFGSLQLRQCPKLRSQITQ